MYVQVGICVNVCIDLYCCDVLFILLQVNCSVAAIVGHLVWNMNQFIFDD